MDRVPADVLHQVVHAFLVVGPSNSLPRLAPTHAAIVVAMGIARRARHLGAVDAHVNAPPPPFADERNVPPDRLELPIGGGDAHARSPVTSARVNSRPESSAPISFAVRWMK